MRPRNRLSALAAFCLLASLLAPLYPASPPGPALAQDDDNPAKGWYGTIVYTKVLDEERDGESEIPLAGGHSIKTTSKVVERYHEQITVQVVDGNATVTASLRESTRSENREAYSVWSCTWEEAVKGGPGVTGNSTRDQRWHVSGSGGIELSLGIEDDGYYSISVPGIELDGSYVERTTSSCSGNCCPDPSGKVPAPPSSFKSEDFRQESEYFGIEGQLEENADRDVLSGTEFTSLDEPAETYTSPAANGGSGTSTTRAIGSRTITWNLYKQLDLELVVEPKQYDTWRPEAVAGGATPGNAIEVVARLQKKDGGPPDRRASKITFELLDVSEEPGVALNYPLASTAGRDLRFDPEFNTSLRVSGRNGDKAETMEGEHVEALAVVSSYDWGAFGRIKATATVRGRQIVGYLKGDKSKTLVPLPKRGEGSLIAEVWKNSIGAGKADDDDGEDQPVGDGNPGDGFSLYEEYRGFYENGRHVEGDPGRKDFFIRDEIGGRSKDGIALFAAVTGLAVHHELTAEEFHVDRVMNINYSRRIPHLVDQHGVILKGEVARGPARAVGGPGNPRKIEHIVISSSFDPGPGGWREVLGMGKGEIVFDDKGNIKDVGSGKVLTDRYASTVAHELLHACNVWHHGSGDVGKQVWTYEKQADGSYAVKEGDQPITVKTEDGVLVSSNAGATATFTRTVWLGVEGGQHSGHEDCIMRYNVADVYRSKAEPQTRYVVLFGELVGIGLCNVNTGTGVNEQNHAPQSRYGNAQNGDCIHQILVNDAVEAPSRRAR